MERLLKDLASLQDRIWLIVDDVQDLRSPDALRQLELLIMRAPPELRFVIATRPRTSAYVSRPGWLRILLAQQRGDLEVAAKQDADPYPTAGS